MTGIDALEALRRGEKVINRHYMNNFFMCVITRLDLKGTQFECSYKSFVWVNIDKKDLINTTDCSNHYIDVSSNVFLLDDWEIVR
jgi:hypothetical protein